MLGKTGLCKNIMTWLLSVNQTPKNQNFTLLIRKMEGKHGEMGLNGVYRKKAFRSKTCKQKSQLCQMA